MDWLTDYKIPVGKVAKTIFDWMKDNLSPLFDAISAVMDAMIAGILWLLQAPHPLILVALPTLVARFASERDVYLQMKYYYDGPLMVVCFLALVVAVAQRRHRLGLTPMRIRAFWSGPQGLAAALLLAVVVDYQIHT
ncbi:MAG TPA: DUF2079 domain-containing protein, partial [Tabrizicola sp.]|nr:DUF2079 domain-containing protein [Tabrizicola sp.]